MAIILVGWLGFGEGFVKLGQPASRRLKIMQVTVMEMLKFNVAEFPSRRLNPAKSRLIPVRQS